MAEVVVCRTKRYSVLNVAVLDEATKALLEHDFIPDDNTDYKRQVYWDRRFAVEPMYEWLATFEICRPGMEAIGVNFAEPNKRALVVGCGNSSFSKDLSVLCPTWTIISVDYSAVVIERMQRMYPELRWVEADMTKLEGFADGEFDYVLDKAAMDALVADEGSSWDPSETSKKSVDDMVRASGRVLKPHGIFSIVTFQPVHFRRRHLERAMANSGLSWKSGTRVKTDENPVNGTEFAVFALERE